MTAANPFAEDYLFDSGPAHSLPSIRRSIPSGTTRGSTIFINGKPKFKSPQVIECPSCGGVLRPGKATIVFQHAREGSREQEVDGFVCECGEQYVPGDTARAAYQRAMRCSGASAVPAPHG